VEKAEADLGTAHRESSLPDDEANLDGVAFHAQQAAEKYLKAVLHGRAIYFPRTHDLQELVGLLDPPDSRLGDLDAQLGQLSSRAVDGRYPGLRVSRTQATDALRLAEEVRRICRDLLGLEP
jgi:HEPN domain-containing protein